MENKTSKDLLGFLNAEYSKLHTAYEQMFWQSSMGDTSIDSLKDKARADLEDFKTNDKIFSAIETKIKEEKNQNLKTRLGYWRDFFATHAVPEEGKEIRKKITILETKLQKKRGARKEGYINPKTKKFTKVSINEMRSLIATNDDGAIRKACFDAIQELAIGNVADYIKLVHLKNEFARILGYKDFYEYKIAIEEKMTKQELFDLWNTIYDKTKYAFANIRNLEKEKPGLRKPWNYGYMMAGSFTKEEDPYFPFEDAIDRWARSFSALGIDYKNGTLVFDLLDRKGKYNNGFCHWPELVRFENGRRLPGRAQLTCNVVLGIPGESAGGMNTLFHEGGHAAHLLNVEMPDVCVNSEYPPLSTAWAETQSMFLDTILSSVEWESRYAKNKKGEAYPFNLYERQLRALNVTAPLSLMGIIMICAFEKEIYESKNLTEEKVIAIAKKHFKRHTDRSTGSLSILEVPHIYSWESSCSYQGYGLAVLALTQWREYFYKKYGYIVDNPNVGKEMKEVWKYGGSKSFPEFVKLATGKKLSATSYIRNANMPITKKLARAKERITTLSQKPFYKKTPNLNVHIRIMNGKKLITDNEKSFDTMTKKYADWLKTQYSSKD